MGLSNRRFGRLRGLGGLLLAFRSLPAWLLAKPGTALARSCERRFFGDIEKGFGLVVDVHGQAATGALIVSNHISWAEIVAMGARLDGDFVAKSEVGEWPVIGNLARRLGVILVARHRPSHSHAQADLVRACLRSGRSVILFPEGTTSIGTTLLPFRTSLFAAADSARCVQPVMVRYTELDGRPLSPKRQREVAWIDDDSLLAGAMRMAKANTRLEMVFLEPLDPKAFPDRKALAEASRSAILAAHAAAPNRPR